MIKRIRKKIVLKIAAILVIIVTLSVVFSIYFFLNAKDRKLERLIEESKSSILKFATLAYARPMWVLDNNTVKGLNIAMLKNPQVKAVNVYDGETFYSGFYSVKRKGILQHLELKSPYSISDSGKEDYLYRVSAPIINEDKKIGKIEIILSYQELEKDVIDSMWMNILSLAVIALMMVLVVFLGASKLIIKPVLNLAETLKNIAKREDYAMRLHARSDDEVGELYDGFNSMMETVQNREKERDAAEYELSTTKDLMLNVINSMPSMLVSIDEDGIVTQWNQTAEIFTGVQFQDAIGKNLWQLVPGLRKYRAYVEDMIADAESRVFYRENLFPELEGYQNLSLFPLSRDGGGELGMVIRIDDITELEKKENQLRQAQKMETVGTLAGGMAHDFNNVLGGIIGTVSLLKYRILEAAEIDVAKIKEYINVIESSGERATEMVQQLLSLSRKNEVNFAPVDLNKTLKNVFSICSNTFDKSIELIPVYSDEAAIVNGDTGYLEQVLLNLSVNGAHAMTLMRSKEQPQGGRLTVSIEKLFADKYFCDSHPEAEEIDYWVLSVNDTGVGMDVKTVAKIFEPFFTTKEKGKGTGLGMAMVFNIVTQHKGFIDVYSEVGIGTKINIYLPKMMEDSSLGKTSHPEHLKLAGEGTILIIDDEKIMRFMGKEILTTCGYEVLIASNGVEGIELFRDHKDEIKMVILDMVMPKLSGRETFLKLKEIDPDVKVILASGYRINNKIKEALSLGMTTFLQKPYTLNRMTKAIRTVLDLIEKETIESET